LLRHFVPACAGLLALACATAAASAVPSPNSAKAARAALAYYGAEVARFEKETWYWQHVMGRPLTPAPRMLASLGPQEVRRAAARWERLAAGVHRLAQHPPQLGAWLCIHRYEGSWRDGGGPYYGGLQMDLGFQQTYGAWLYRSKGTADHWTPLEQIWTAARAARSRGFWPWPNTARLCGLL
jgi:hypothetical protein